mgnify:CR=1 FL=1
MHIYKLQDLPNDLNKIMFKKLKKIMSKKTKPSSGMKEMSEEMERMRAMNDAHKEEIAKLISEGEKKIEEAIEEVMEEAMEERVEYMKNMDKVLDKMNVVLRKIK